jgi:hypothetical protein
MDFQVVEFVPPDYVSFAPADEGLACAIGCADKSYIRSQTSLAEYIHDHQKGRNGMPIVQAAIVRAVSVLSDSLGVSTLTAGGQTRARLAHVRSEGPSSVQRFCSTQAVPPRELRQFRIAAPLINPIPPAPGHDSDRHRSMRRTQNVSFCNNSAPCKPGRGLLMGGFLRGMQ